MSLDWPIDVIKSECLSDMKYQQLKRRGIHTLGQLCDMTRLELSTIPTFGVAAIDKIDYALKLQGLSGLKGSPIREKSSRKDGHHYVEVR